MEQKIVELLNYRELIKNGSLSFEQFVLFLENVNAILTGKNLGDESTGIYQGYMLAGDLVSPTNKVQMEILRQYYDALHKIENPKEKSALSYYILNNLHLFEDGNGRTSRFMYQFFDNNFDIDYVVHNESDFSIKGTIIEQDKNIKDVDTVNYMANYILFKNLISNGIIKNDVRLQKYNIIRTFGKSSFILSHTNQTDLPESVKEALGATDLERFEKNITNNNGNITVAGISMCIMLTKLGILEQALDKNEENIKEMKKAPISGINYDKRLIFRVGSKELKKSDIDFSNWSANMCNDFSSISEDIHKQQLQTLIDIFINPKRYMYDQNSTFLSQIINEETYTDTNTHRL